MKTSAEVSVLLDRLRDIPFMSLQREFDLARMQQEAVKVDRYVPYQTIYGDEKLKAKYAHAWAGRSLLSYDEDSSVGMTEFVGSERAKMPTDLAPTCPYIMEVVKSLRGHFRHARLMRIAPQSSLMWHSHVDNQGQRPSSLTVHVPIFMPEEFFYSVTHKSNVLGAMDQKRVWNAKFSAGRATYFNSYHYHNVFNKSDQERISLMIYVGLYDPQTFDMFESALNKYTGPKVV